MVKVKLEDKDFAERKAYFEAGAHEVFIKAARRGESTGTGTPFIEFDLEGEDGEGNVRLWISEKAAPYTLARLAQVAVHNKSSEADKEKVREAFKKIADTDELDDKFLQKFVEMQAWILTEEDKSSPKPNGGFYLRNNLYSYEPKPRKTTVEDLISGGEKVDLDEVPFGDS